MAVQELRKVIETERYNRIQVWANGTVRSQRMPARKVVGRITKEEVLLFPFVWQKTNDFSAEVS